MAKRIISMLLCLVIVLSLCACGGNQGSQESTQPQGNQGEANLEISGNEVTYGNANSATVKHEKVVIALNADPQDLVPVNVNVGGKEVLDSIFERLYNIDGFGGPLYGVLAKEIPVEVETNVFEFEIYDNIYDSDGNHITASDVVFSTNYLVDSGYAQNFGKFDHIEAVGDYTLRIHTNAPLNELGDYANIFGVIYVWSEKAMQDHNFATDPCGTGPYVCTYFRSGDKLILEASDKYWAEGTDHQNSRSCANVQTIEYQIISEQSQNTVALRTDTIDYTTNLSDTDKAKFMAGGEYSEGWETYSWPSNLTYYLMPNCSGSSLCGDENLRKAIMYAIDPTVILAVADTASAQVVYDMANGKFAGYNEEWKNQNDFYAARNIELAKEYLAKSNYKGETLTLLFTSGNLLQNVCETIQILLGEIGINVELKPESFSVTSADVVDPTAWDLYVDMMASDDYLVIVYARLFRSSNFDDGQGTKNFIQDPQLQALIDTCMTDAGNTQENLDALHNYVVEHAYSRGLFAAYESAIYSSDILQVCNSYKYAIIPGGCIYADNTWE